MLVGSCVDDYLRPVDPEHPVQGILVGYTADFNSDHQLYVGNPELLLYVVGSVLIDIKYHQLSGLHLGKLSAELRTD